MITELILSNLAERLNNVELVVASLIDENKQSKPHTWQKRLVNEYNELSKKLLSLNEFINAVNNGILKYTGKSNFNNLLKQRQTMTDYKAILNRRLNDEGIKH